MDRHLDHYVQVARNAYGRYSGHDAASGVASFEAAWDNLRAALDHAVANRDAMRANAIVVATHWYAYLGLRAEHVEWVAHARSVSPDDPVLTGIAGMWASLQGDQQAAARLGAEAVAAAPSGAAEALCGWLALTYAHFYSSRQVEGAVTCRAAEAACAASPEPFVRALVASFCCLVTYYEDPAAGLAHLERATELSTELSNGPAVAWASYQSGNMQFGSGAFDRALVDYERAIELAVQNGSRLLEMWARTMVAARAGDAGWPDAERRFAESLVHLAETRIWSRVYAVLAAVADHFARRGRMETAAKLIGFLEVRDPVGLFLIATQRARAEAAVAAHPDGARWRTEGARITRESIIDFALSTLDATSSRRWP
jgi:hypothetical protein